MLGLTPGLITDARSYEQETAPPSRPPRAGRSQSYVLRSRTDRGARLCLKRQYRPHRGSTRKLTTRAARGLRGRVINARMGTGKLATDCTITRPSCRELPFVRRLTTRRRAVLGEPSTVRVTPWRRAPLTYARVWGLTGRTCRLVFFAQRSTLTPFVDSHFRLLGTQSRAVRVQHQRSCPDSPKTSRSKTTRVRRTARVDRLHDMEHDGGRGLSGSVPTHLAEPRPAAIQLLIRSLEDRPQRTRSRSCTSTNTTNSPPPEACLPPPPVRAGVRTRPKL